MRDSIDELFNNKIQNSVPAPHVIKPVLFSIWTMTQNLPNNNRYFPYELSEI